jgi:capsular exopolysaccharide synthesis family protein
VSKFFKALEQADRERARLESVAWPELSTDIESQTAVDEPVGPSTATRTETIPRGPGRPRRAPGVGLDLPLLSPLDRARTRASVGAMPGQVEEHFVSLVMPASFEAEQYRALRHVVEQLRRSAQLTVIAVSSPGNGDGKTTTAINLAGSLAQAPDARVILVDADLRRPAIAPRLGLDAPGAPGLVDVITEQKLRLEHVVRQCNPYNLAVLPAGQPSQTPYDVLQSPRLGTLLDELRQRYDYVIVDTPPIVHVPDCRVIGNRVDGFLVVVAAHRTPQKLVAEVFNVLEPAKFLGFVFNRNDRSIPGYYRPYYRSGNGHPDDDE